MHTAGWRCFFAVHGPFAQPQPSMLVGMLCALVPLVILVWGIWTPTLPSGIAQGFVAEVAQQVFFWGGG